MNIGKRVKQVRLEIGMSQKKLADIVGVKQPTISELETGESKGTTNVATFAAALGVNAYWLQTGVGNKYAVEEISETYHIDKIWPFSITYDQYMRIDPRDRKKIDGMIKSYFDEIEHIDEKKTA